MRLSTATSTTGEEEASTRVPAGNCIRNGTDGTLSAAIPRRKSRFSGNVLTTSARPFFPIDRSETGV